jgi:hypothetical protein
MGDPRRVFHSPECYKALPWTATIADRIGHLGLFQDINRESRILLCSVSLVIWMLWSCLTEVPHLLALLLWLASRLSHCFHTSWCANLWLAATADHSLQDPDYAVGNAIFFGVLSIAEVLQMFVLGPRLVLSIREHHTKVMARADGGTGMTSIAFHAGGDVSMIGRDV